MTLKTLLFQVIQFECGDTQGGPPDCLQYFTGTSGEIASYNFPTSLSTITSTGTFDIKNNENSL